MSPPSARSGSGSASSARLILASASPRRRELLGGLGVDFEVVVPEVEELRRGDPDVVVLENARRKAHAGRALAGGGLALGVDTDVAVEGALLGKPTDADQARRHLEALSGRTHEVLSGVVVVDTAIEGQIPVERSGIARTEVGFRDLDSATIDLYIDSGEWRDRAGGYAVQGLGSILVERLEGDFSNVVGLPITLLLHLVPDLISRPKP